MVSKSLREVRSKRTQLIPELDAAALKQLKLNAQKDLSIRQSDPRVCPSWRKG